MLEILYLTFALLDSGERLGLSERASGRLAFENVARFGLADHLITPMISIDKKAVPVNVFLTTMRAVPKS